MKRDSGRIFNPQLEARTVHTEKIRVAGAAWLRLYFGEVELGPGSYLKITGAADGEVQELDARALAMWSNTSAYFNGDSVDVDVVAGPQSPIRMMLEEIAYWTPDAPLSLCGADDRIPSDEDWSGRIEPIGCSGAMWKENCLISAGHCFPGSAQLIEFRVPQNAPNCSHQHPPVADQFPIIDSEHQSNGVGQDWAVAKTGTNNLGQTPLERYGEIRTLALVPPAIDDPVEIWGYGTDNECLRSGTQQYSEGVITGGGATHISHDADTEGGNSGTGVISNGRLIAVHTHGGCPANKGTLLSQINFATARATQCLLPAGEVTFDRAVYRCGDAVEVRIEDSSLIGGPPVMPLMLASGTESVDENLSLPQAYQAVYGISVPLSTDPAVNGDGVLSVAHGDTITATYLDADDGTGSPADVVATVSVDCQAPVIDNIQVEVLGGTSARFTWDTDEPSTSTVGLLGPSAAVTEPALVTTHVVVRNDLESCTQYRFRVASVDPVGNTSIDNNSGAWYPFQTACQPPPVPDGSLGADPVTVAKLPDDTIQVFWDDSCVGSGPSRILYGALDDVSQYTISGAVCDIPVIDDNLVWDEPSGDLWFVVVRGNVSNVEGSWGQSSTGERNGSSPSFQCGSLVKNSAGTCP